MHPTKWWEEVSFTFEFALHNHFVWTLTWTAVIIAEIPGGALQAGLHIALSMGQLFPSAAVCAAW